MCYSYYARFDRVRWLLARGADVNIANIRGETALILACKTWLPETAAIETIRALIAAGADVNRATVYGLTPLSFSTVSALIAAGSAPL